MIYVLGYPKFSAELTAALDRFRAAHEPDRAKLVRPHVTLVFGLTGVDPGGFADFCKETIAGTDPIKVDFDRCALEHDPLEGNHKLMLICRQGRQALTELHRALYDGPHRAQLDRARPYRPHMTVATNADRAALESLDLSPLGPFPIRGVVDEAEAVSLSEGRLHRLSATSLRA